MANECDHKINIETIYIEENLANGKRTFRPNPPIFGALDVIYVSICEECGDISMKSVADFVDREQEGKE